MGRSRRKSGRVLFHTLARDVPAGLDRYPLAGGPEGDMVDPGLAAIIGIAPCAFAPELARCEAVGDADGVDEGVVQHLQCRGSPDEALGFVAVPGAVAGIAVVMQVLLQEAAGQVESQIIGRRQSDRSAKRPGPERILPLAAPVFVEVRIAFAVGARR